MGFHEVMIEICDEREGESLIAEYYKLKKIYEQHGGKDHGYTIVAQIFGSKTGPPHYFLSGRILNPEESKAFADILAKGKGER